MLRYDLQLCRQLLVPGGGPATLDVLSGIGFVDVAAASERFQRLAGGERERQSLAELLPAVLLGLESAHTPDQALLNFERFVNAIPDRQQLFTALATSPRQVEILLRLFVSSQFLTEILIRHPESLDRLAHHQRLAEIKSLPQMLRDAEQSHASADSPPAQLAALQQFQQREILRLAACDTFHLMDLRTITQQLSRLADAVVQSCLTIVARNLGVDAGDFAVLAFGKLGAEELNYSSDIDLVFVARRDAERQWKLGQRLIAALSDAAGGGFLYRVDMRLRPWGKSGPLVTTIDAYLDYLHRQARPWELQALLKARAIAGEMAIGETFLESAEPLVFSLPDDVARRSIRDMLDAIIPEGASPATALAEVKTGPGGIREIEFLTQYLQLLYGRELPAVRKRSTLEALTQLADAELILPGEFQHLSSAYIFQRSVEHSLQLTHNRQKYRLPAEPRELEYLAARLDFHSAEQFLAHYTGHREFVRDIARRRFDGVPVDAESDRLAMDMSRHLGDAAEGYGEAFTDGERREHVRLLERIGPDCPVCTAVRQLPTGDWELTVVGVDLLGDLSLMCGLLFVRGFDIKAGYVFTGADLAASSPSHKRRGRHSDGTRKFVNVFTVQPPEKGDPAALWGTYESDLAMLFRLASEGRLEEAQGWLARQLAVSLPRPDASAVRLQPVEIAIENDVVDDATVMLIRGEDTPGFLYELCNALAVSEVSIQRMLIQSSSTVVTDTLQVTTADGRKITDSQRLQELRAAVILTKHFTHLLWNSANPSAALLHFRTLLRDLFRQTHWLDQLGSMQQPEVLEALVKVLGESDFLWEDFLRLHHGELFPVISDQEALREVRSADRLLADLESEIVGKCDPEERRRVLNVFKDREMFRIDMRHILGLQQEFGLFSQELTALAEAVCRTALKICQEELELRYGVPVDPAGNPLPLSLCALGKCGGAELGFASDIELMFLYDGDGETNGPEKIGAAEFFVRLVESFRRSIQARQKGIFEIDLRLRPFGNAGSLAVAKGTFARYYSPVGPAWPFERQALVKLRPIAGDVEFGAEIVALRDQLVYTGEPFDLASMRGMRERQIRELVQAGQFNAKLSYGGLVDCEYFVQALQITFGKDCAPLRSANTRAALRTLEQIGILSDRLPLRNAYRFFRRLIDALRMVRGDARDLNVPPIESDEFEFLERRLAASLEGAPLEAELARHSQTVRDHLQRLDALIAQSSPRQSPSVE